MKTYYDLTLEEREKYRKEFKSTPVGKELYSNFYWTIIVLIIVAFVYGSLQGNIFDFENLSPWYVFKKRVRLAFYKLIYVLPAFLFGEEDDSEN